MKRAVFLFFFILTGHALKDLNDISFVDSWQKMCIEWAKKIINLYILNLSKKKD